MFGRCVSLLFLLTWITLRPAVAQLEPSVRVELPTDNNDNDTYDVLPLGDQGVLLTIRHGDYYSSAPEKFSFRKYDGNLKPVWETDYKIDAYFEPIMSCQTEHYFFWLFKESNSEKISVLRLGLDDGQTEIFKGSLLTQIEISQFKVLDNVAYVGGNYRSRPVVVAFSFFDKSAKVLPGLYINHVQLNNIEVDPNRRLVHVMTDATTQRNCEFTIRTYTYEGRLVRTVNMDGMKHSLISGKLLPVSDDESLLVGNYSIDCTPYSQGIYVTRIRNGEVVEQDTRYIDFSQLQNFFNYLKPKRQQKMIDKISRRRSQGKDTKFRYRLLVHDLMPTPNGPMLIAEVFYPQYKGNSTPISFGSMRNFDRSQEGYRFTHAFLCGFDPGGRLIWDNCVPVKDVISYELHPMVQVSQQGNRTVLAYPQEGEITTEVLEGSKLLPLRQNYSLKEVSENEKVVYSEQDHLEAWFDRHFLAYGIQKISSEKYSGPSREVFYINKLSYNPDLVKPSGEATGREKSSRKTSGSER
ncbi:hypothetical protein [Tellurirhabdus rosea]|uniref:hypothetical protein n=1 Tax=Tellurirhabdus rosea TaxID=2674997 RepID=UPI00225107F3|nr:hypothetical protein [Tellurirhabdus rosea]